MNFLKTILVNNRFICQLTADFEHENMSAECLQEPLATAGGTGWNHDL